MINKHACEFGAGLTTSKIRLLSTPLTLGPGKKITLCTFENVDEIQKMVIYKMNKIFIATLAVASYSTLSEV